MRRGILAVALACVLLVLVLSVQGQSPSPSAPATPTATRLLADQVHTCGEDFFVTVRIDLPPGTRQWGLDEKLPKGWTARGASEGGSIATPGHVKWFRFDAAGTNSTVLQYVVAIPIGAKGNFSMTGEFAAEGIAGTVAPSGDHDVEVQCDRQAPAAPGGEDSFSLPPWLLWLVVAAVVGVLVVAVPRWMKARKPRQPGQP